MISLGKRASPPPLSSEPLFGRAIRAWRGSLPLNLTAIGHESRRLQAALNLWCFHERLPNASASIVLDHDENRALIDPQNFGVPPVGREVEGVAETVGRPDVLSITIVKMTHRRNGDFRRKRNRPASPPGR